MKKIIPILLCLLLILSMTIAASAASPKIVDDAGLLTESQVQALEEKARQLTEKYEMDVVIVTVWSLDGKTSTAYADDYFDYNGYGIGEDYSGVLFLLSMEYRDWAISTCGETIYALTDYGIESLFSAVSGYLADDEYYEAFDAYLDELPAYFDAYREGDPIDGYIGGYDGPGTYEPGPQDDIYYYDYGPGAGDIIKMILIGLVIGAVAGGLTIFVMSRQMNTARSQSGAKSYMVGGTYELRQRQDIFLYSRVSKVRKADNSNNSSRGGRGGGGGSSVHRSSSGRSHGGGRGKF